MDPIKQLQQQLTAGKVTRFVVIYLPFGRMFVFRQTLESVMRSVVYQLKVKEGISPRHPVVARLLTELNKSKMRHNKSLDRYMNQLDLRWGFLFYDQAGKCVFTLLLDRLPEYGNSSRDQGFLNGRYVTVNRNLRTWYLSFLRRLPGDPIHKPWSIP